MKFITISTIKDTFFTMLPAMVRQITEAVKASGQSIKSLHNTWM